MSKIMIGTDEVLKVMFGLDEVSSLAMGEETIPITPPTPPAPDYSSMPFTIEVGGSDNISRALRFWNNTISNTSRTYYYSLNGGQKTLFTIDDTNKFFNLTVKSGDTISFTVPNDQDGTATAYNKYYAFVENSGLEYKVYGNIMSLCYVDFESATTIPNDYCFYCLFTGNTSIVDAENLIIPLADKANSYKSMFKGCRKLATAPELPTESLGSYCYDSMFFGCTGLTSGPTILPATVLKYACYQQMFYNCTSLTTAPELPNTTKRGTNCCSAMFQGCTNLNYVKCLATTTTNTTNWLDGVSATGTFVKDANTTWSSGVNGIPTGWTVVDA